MRRDEEDVSRPTMSVERSRRVLGGEERRMGEKAGWGGAGEMFKGRTGTAGREAGEVGRDLRTGLVVVMGVPGMARVDNDLLCAGLGVLLLSTTISPSSESMSELFDAKGIGGRGGEGGSSSS